MMVATEYPHIERDERGRLFVKGAPYKVLVLLRDHTAWGWDAAAMHRQHPRLSLAQAHAVLAYYYDHKEEVDAALAEQDRQDETFVAGQTPFEAMERLRQLKRGQGT